MLFYDFYQKLQRAIGEKELEKFPPDNEKKYKKLFMLMTLSGNYKSKEDCLSQLKTLNDIFKNLKECLKKLIVNHQEFKSIVKGYESLDILKDSLNVYSFIKDKDILSINEKIVPSFFSYNDRLFCTQVFIECFKGEPTERLKDELRTSLKDILDKNFNKAILNKDILRDIFKASLNKDIDIHESGFNKVGIDKTIHKSLKELIKSEFHKACLDINNHDSLKCILKKFPKEKGDIIKKRFESYKDKNTAEASFIEILKKDSLTRRDYEEAVDIHMDTHINTLIDILTDSLIDRLDINRTVIDSIFKVINFKDLKDNDKSIDNYINTINEDIYTIDFSEFNKFVAEVEDEARRAEEKRKSRAEKSKKFEDLFSENDIQIIHRYIKYFGFSLKNVFSDYSDVSDWQIKEYVNYLYFWVKKNDKDSTFKKYCNDSKDSINGLAKEITPYLVSHPYFIDVVNNLPDEQKRKIYEEFKAEIGSLKITPYLANSPYFIDDINNLPDEQKGKIYEKLKAGIGALEITSNLANLPYFIGDINNLPDKQKGKIYEELNAEIGSLDFLGEKLATLLKMIIDEATNKDLKIFEELWEKEKDNLLEMVLYPILHELFGSNSATYVPRYSLSLKIRNENNAVIIEKHPDTFLDNLFFFIAKKKNIFFNHFKLMDIHYSRVHIGGVICKWTTDDEIYGNKNNKNNKTGLLLSLKYGPLYYDLINFLPGVKFFSTSIEYLDTLNFPPKVKKVFTRITYTYRDEERSFKDIKHILEFKKNLKNSIYDYDDSFVLIELNPFFDYFKKNKKEIDKNLVCTNIEKTREQKNFWKDKCKSELYKYIREKLKTEEAQSHIQTPFQRLKDYYLQGECPADPGSLSIMDLYEPSPEA